MSRQVIGITGFGLAACLGLTGEEVWSRVQANICGMKPVTALESPAPPGTESGGQCPDLPAAYHPNLPREVRYLRWVLEAALQSAGLTNGANSKRVGLILGTTLHGMRAAGAYLRSEDPVHLRNFLGGDTIRMAADGLPISGLRITTCSACSSSLGAIALAATWIEAGEADVVLAGGYDPISEYAWGGFNSLRVISGPPLRPFTRGRAGMKLAEGYGILVVESQAHAESRHTRPLAFVAGWGESADAFHLTRPEPAGAGALQSMRQALERAEVLPTQIDLIAAHATGTPDNDASEAAALTALMPAGTAPVVGFKSHLGHTLGGAGAVELILSMLAMRDGITPACASTRSEEIEFPAINVSVKPGRKAIAHTLNNSLGFGGANTTVVLKNAPTRMKFAAAGREVVITGAAAILPGYIGLQSLTGPAASPITPLRQLFEEEELLPLINARKARRMSPYVKQQLAAAGMALEMAGLTGDTLALLSAILATTHGSSSFCYDYYSQLVREGLAAANPVLFAEGVPNAAAAQISLLLGLKGGCQTFIGTTTCGIEALQLAAARIGTGACERVLVGAAEESHWSLDKAYAACREGVRPSCSCAVAFVLESAESAQKRRTKPLAVLPTRSDAGLSALPGVLSTAAPEVDASHEYFSAGPLLSLAKAIGLGMSSVVAIKKVDRTGTRAELVISPHA